MTDLWAYDFEAPVPSGTVMTPSNSNFKNLVQPGWTFSNAHLLTSGGGTLAGRCTTSAGTAQANDNGRPWASTNVIYYRFYVYIEQLPDSSTNVLSLWAGPTPGPATTAATCRITSSGQVQIKDNTSTQVAISQTGLLSAGTYARIAVKLDVTNNQQQLKVFVGSNVHGTTADYDSGLVTSAAGGVGITSFALGILNACTATLHFDNLTFSDSGFPGPVTTGSITANAGADQTVGTRTMVTLTGTDTGTILTRGWSQASGRPVSYTVVTANTVMFTSVDAIPEDLSLHRYSVTDASGNTASDTVQITSQPMTWIKIKAGVDKPYTIQRVHQSTPPTVPSAPQNVVATLTSGTRPYSASISWTAPASNGGSAITGYTVTQRGGVTHTLGPSATSDSFTGLTTIPPETFSVAAVNAVGTGPAVVVSTTGVGGAYRFPGDCLPLQTGRIIVGCTEQDNNGMTVKAGWEFLAPEKDTGLKYGAMKAFYGGDFSTMTPGTGAMFKDWATYAARGHIIVASLAIQQSGQTWRQSATNLQPGGSLYNIFYNFIAGIEESTTVNAPFWFILVHEPQQGSKVSSNPADGMLPSDYADMQKAVRAIMDAYATAKSGSASAYTWKNFAFGGLHTGEAFTVGPSNIKNIDGFYTDGSGVPLPVRTHDFVGSDTYQQPISGVTADGRTGVPLWNSPMKATCDWCKGKGIPTVIGEYGVHNTDADAGSQLQDFWNHATAGTYDIVAILYFNSAPDGPIINPTGAVGRWLFTNYYMNDPSRGSNSGLADVFYSMMRDPKAARYWDLGYPKPAGV